MSRLDVTDQELLRAYNQNFSAYNVETRNNAHRLLLFYSVECGLKFLILRNNEVTNTHDCPDFTNYKHDLDKLLNVLPGGASYRINKTLQIDDLVLLPSNAKQRCFQISQLNEAWRYGTSLSRQIKDQDLEEELLKIYYWIESEISRIR